LFTNWDYNKIQQVRISVAENKAILAYLSIAYTIASLSGYMSV